METTSYIALSRQQALRNEMSAIANNMANMNTTGYKGERMLFVDQLVRSRSDASIADQKLSYVRDIASFRNTMDGPLTQTNNPLDLALNGDGYFSVQTAGGERYTRNGSLTMDAGGQLVTQQGDPVLTDAGTPIFFAPEDTQITITGDGTISTENGELGKLKIVSFNNQQDMFRAEGGYFATNEQPNIIARPKIAQGMIEGSNVESITEMTRMMEVSRQYMSAQKMIDREDERIRRMVSELPSLTSGQ
ncbi:MAG: flagellar basal-body rod protein FlgF [Rhodospirillaceae bacterium]|nr:flagellar basal-body rod protein FlgF [Rhodospirillaceae bacterium]